MKIIGSTRWRDRTGFIHQSNFSEKSQSIWREGGYQSRFSIWSGKPFSFKLFSFNENSKWKFFTNREEVFEADIEGRKPMPPPELKILRKSIN